MNLESITVRALQLLGDPAGARFAADLLAEAARGALAAYSRALPDLAEVELTAAQDGWRLCLTDLGDFSAVQSVSLNQRELRGWRLVRINGAPTLLLPCGCPLKTGQALTVTVSRAHRLEGLDGSPDTTLPENHAGLLALGVAARASAMRAALVLESPARRPEDAAALMARAAVLGEEFRQGLRSALPGGDFLPRSGWDSRRAG